MLLAGLGVGALASQLGSVTVSSVSDEQSGEVGGLQNTVTNLGASIGTALAGRGADRRPEHLVPDGGSAEPRGAERGQIEGRRRAGRWRAVRLGRANCEAPWRIGAASSPQATDAIVEENETARLAALRSSLSVLALIALIALLFSRGIPTEQPAAAGSATSAPPREPGTEPQAA